MSELDIKIPCMCKEGELEDTGKKTGLCYGNPIYEDFSVYACGKCKRQALFVFLKEDEYHKVK